jgi:ribosomal peptide maturation radical SAM protein 1
MPHSPVERPSLAIGLLQAILKQNGISVAAMYANILWCERTGMAVYRIAKHVENQFGEWIFSPAAFPGFQPDSDSYLRLIFKKPVLASLGIKREQLPALLSRVRHEATDFIDATARGIVAQAPSIVGCSSTNATHVSSLALFKRIRELAPNIVTMMGGANCESIMGLTTHENFPWVDYVVSGEADGIIVDLVRAVLKEGREVGPARLPAGVFAPVHRTLDYAGLRENPPRVITVSLQGLPTPCYDDYFTTLKNAPVLGDVVHPGLPVEGSRGCWWGDKRQCTFCALNGGAIEYRNRPVAEVLKDLETLLDRHGVKRLAFADNILNPGWFTSLFPKLAELNRPYTISCETTPNLTKDQIRIMAEAGVKWVQPGIESMDPEILILLNKGTKAWRNVRFLKWCLYYGIYVYWFLLDRVPAQDNSWYARTRELIPSLHHLSPPVLLNPILFCRFSMYHAKPDRFGLHLEPFPGYRCTYPLSQGELSMLAYHFINGEGSAEKLNDSDPEVDDPLERKALIDDLVEWTRLFRSEQRPVLRTTDTGTELHVRDTRPVAVEESFCLSGEERAVYLACEDGIRPELLYARLSEEGVPATAAKEIVSDLVERRLLLLIDNHLMSLGIPEPLTEVPNNVQQSCGWIDDALYDALMYVTGRQESQSSS